MFYAAIGSMAVYTGIKLINFIWNRKKIKSMGEIDSMLLNLINDQGAKNEQ